MINLIRKFLGRNSYQALNKIEIYQENLLKNYQYLSQIDPKVKIAPVLKSNAYGHGINLIARLLDNQGAPFFCVDSLFEAYEILKLNVKTPVLIMGQINPQNLSIKKLPFCYAVYDVETAEGIAKYQPHADVHIFVDTGMHREGVLLSDLPKFLQDIKKFNLNIVGVMSHLAIGGEPKHPLTKQQIKEFEETIRICQKMGFKLRYLHLGGSNAILHSRSKLCNIVRTGIALYGIDPTVIKSNLKPILSLKTKIAFIKKIKKGHSIGYNAKFTAKEDMTIGTLPLGYYDGVDRRLSNKGVVQVDSVACAILGFASMNITTIDLSKVKNPYVGQEVIVYSSNPEDTNSILNAAKICKTNPHELLVHLAASTRRVVL